MLRTITIGSCVLVQGLFERQSDSGKIVIRVGEALFEGRPIERPSLTAL